jgi:LVIVD repeat
MKSFKKTLFWFVLVLTTVLIALPSVASQGDFYTSYAEPQVIAHLPLSGQPADQMFLQQQGRKQYLYVQQGGQEGFTIVDVSKPKHPKVLKQVPQQNIRTLGAGLAITEKPATASPAENALPNSEGVRGGGGGSVPDQVRVLDVSNPAHPKTVETLDGVTSIVSDDARGLVYVANGDGVWILSHQQILRRHLCSSSDAISSAEPNCD